jgi:hypothetical protein
MKTRTVLCYDMDGCLCREICWSKEACLQATPNQKMIDDCNGHYEDAITIIYTARADSLLENTVVWLRNHGVRYWGINNTKMHFDNLIDDCVTNVRDVV